MIILIDAYNVLKQALRVTRIAEKEKQRFIHQLGAYAQRKGHAIMLFFDGGSYDWTDTEKIAGIQVIHSGVHENADTVIKRYLDKYKKYDILLVSTDRDLGSYASRLAVESLDAADFYHILSAELQSKGELPLKREQAVKTSVTSQLEVDQLLEQESGVVSHKAVDIVAQTSRTKAKHQLSKKERKLLQKVKKL